MIKKILAAVLCAILVLSTAACASGTAPASSAAPAPASSAAPAPASSAAPAAPAEPDKPFNWDANTPITMMRPLYEAQPPAENSPVQKAMEEALGVKFQSRWVPTGTFTEVFNTTLATKDIPMLIAAPSSLTVNPGFMKYCNAGVFWDLTDEINNNKAFWDENTVNEICLKAASINGRNYYFPQIVAAGRVGVIYRQDWAEKVGAPAPDSLENFYKMAQMFTENDPDGNGKKDTYGFAYIDDADKELAYAGFSSLAVANGAPNLWGKKDGKFYPYFESEGYVKTLDFFKDMYDKGYMNDDFYLIKGNDKYSPMLAGTAGMMMTSANNAAMPGGKFDPLVKENPAAKIAYSTCFNTANGKVTNSTISVGAMGGTMMPKNAVSEDQMKELMKMFAYIKSEDTDKLIVFGVEGIHYTINKDGKIESTNDQITLRKNDGSNDAFGSLFPRRILDDYGQVLTPNQIIVRDIIPSDEFAVPDESAGVMDGDMLTKYTSIATTISDARVQYIIGKIDLAGFNAQVQAWKDAGGQEIIDKLNG